jgi:SAM-dependent methyltransferase
MVVNRPGAGPAGALLSLNNIVPTCEAQSYECENSNENDSDAFSVYTGLTHDQMLHPPEPQGNRRRALSPPKTYTPALRFHRLTGAYDWVLSRTMPEKAFKSALLSQASIAPAHRVLDFGCGTGTLTLMAQAAVKDAQVIGVDIDDGALALARAKCSSAKTAATFVKISSGPLPFEDRSFDRVLSCLVFHHLRRDEKLSALAECRRVLRPAGEIHVGDWGHPESPLLRAGFFLTQLLDGFETTGDHVLGRMPTLISQAGFLDVVDTGHFPTLFGSLRLMRGRVR